MKKKPEPKRRPGRPSEGGPTPRRSLRISDEDWKAAKEISKRAGWKSITEWVIDMIHKASVRK